MNRRLAMLQVIAADALIAACADFEIERPKKDDLGPLPDDLPLAPNAKAVIDERIEAGARRHVREIVRGGARYMPHVGKKQIAKALKRMEQGT